MTAIRQRKRNHGFDYGIQNKDKDLFHFQLFDIVGR
jgi:hypothetical protein